MKPNRIFPFKAPATTTDVGSVLDYISNKNSVGLKLKECVPYFNLHPHARCWVDGPGRGWFLPLPHTRVIEPKVQSLCEEAGWVVVCCCWWAPGLNPPRPHHPEL